MTHNAACYLTCLSLKHDHETKCSFYYCQVYRLGLRLEEIDEEIADQLRRQKEENHDAEYENDLLRFVCTLTILSFHSLFDRLVV